MRVHVRLKRPECSDETLVSSLSAYIALLIERKPQSAFHHLLAAVDGK